MRISDWSSYVCSSDLAEPLGIGEVLHRRRAGRRDIDDAGIGQGVLEPQIGAALLRERLLAALALTAGGVGHRVRLVEDDHAVEVGAQPVDDLLDAANLLAAFLRTQRRIGGEQHARIELDRRSEEHTSELQSLMRTSYAVFCLKT